MATPEPRQIGLARTHDELVDLLAARKEDLGLSNAFIDTYWSYAAGMTDKYLGPTRVKTLGRQSLDDFLMILGLSIVLIEDPDKLRRMESQYEKRKPGYAHSPRVSKLAVTKALPIIMRELSVKAAEARRCIPDKHRSAIARKAAKKRWEIHRRKKREAQNGSEKTSHQRARSAAPKAPGPRISRRRAQAKCGAHATIA